MKRCEHCRSLVGHAPSCIIKEWVIIQTLENRAETIDEFQRNEDEKTRIWFMRGNPFILKAIHFPMYPILESLVIGVYEQLVTPIPTVLQWLTLNHIVVRPGEIVTLTFRKTL